jgi:hypothetical protein
MKSRHRSFNIFFALACVALAGGCAEIQKMTGPKKEETTIRLYLEGEKADKATVGTVLVTSNKYPYTIQREPFLNEGDLAKASIVKDPGGDGGYSIQLAFDDHGTLVLDMYTADSKGKHVIVFSQFPKKGYKPPKAKEKKKSDDSDESDLVESGDIGPVTDTNATRQSGWLAAVLIRQRISTGVFRFTPDASPAEGRRIVRGLRNVIEEKSKLDK